MSYEQALTLAIASTLKRVIAWAEIVAELQAAPKPGGWVSPELSLKVDSMKKEAQAFLKANSTVQDDALCAWRHAGWCGDMIPEQRVEHWCREFANAVASAAKHGSREHIERCINSLLRECLFMER